MTPEPTTTIIVRHAATCPDKDEGLYWKKCDCRKSFIAYDGVTRNAKGKLVNRIISAKTRSWSKAEEVAKEWRDSFNPDKQKIKLLTAEKERTEVRIEDAVALYLANMTRNCSKGTVDLHKSLLGRVDPTTKQVERSGHLFTHLGKQVPRPTFVSELTPTFFTEWRSTWKFNDLTSRQRWTIVTSFLNFCVGQKWMADSPARGLTPPRVQKGNRTAAFTDAQYDAILNAVPLYQPDNVPTQTQRSWQQRLTTFLELLRWTGMDVIDAIHYRPEWVDKDGVLRYTRQKTDVLATIPLPEHLIILLRDVPLEAGSVGPHQPFRNTDTDASINATTWRMRLHRVFDLSGITQVETGLGRVRRPHPKMLRDTFAIHHLRQGVPIYSVSRMLGHTKTEQTETAYLPYVSELDAAHIAAVRKTMVGPPKKRGRKVVQMR